jgi:hypothetical protein
VLKERRRGGLRKGRRESERSERRGGRGRRKVREDRGEKYVKGKSNY